MTKRDWQAFKAIRLARHFIGIPYRWNGKTPQGFDCSGLVCEILQCVGILKHGSVLDSVRKRAYVRQRRIDRRDDIVGYADPFMEAV